MVGSKYRLRHKKKNKVCCGDWKNQSFHHTVKQLTQKQTKLKNKIVYCKRCESVQSLQSFLRITDSQPNPISQACSTQSWLIKITIRFMFYTQRYTNMIDINYHLVCGEKRPSEMVDCSADVSFYCSAGAGREVWTLYNLLL